MILLIGGWIFALIVRIKSAKILARQGPNGYVRWGHLNQNQIRWLTSCLFAYFMFPFSIIAVPAAIYLAVRAIIGYKNKGEKGRKRRGPNDEDYIDVEYREL